MFGPVCASNVSANHNQEIQAYTAGYRVVVGQITGLGPCKLTFFNVSLAFNDRDIQPMFSQTQSKRALIHEDTV